MKREALFLVAISALLLVALPAGASVVWSENFENSTINMNWTVHNVASGWMGFWSRGDNYGGSNAEVHHVTDETDVTNPASGTNGTPLGTETFSGTNDKQASIGNPSGSGAGIYGGIFKIITGLPINTPLTLDGYTRCRGGVGTSTSKTAWANVVVNDDITQLPAAAGGDYNYGTQLWQVTRTNTNPNGGGLMSVWKTTYNGTFTTTDGTIVLLLRVGVAGIANNTTTFDFDDIFITPEPASLGFFVVGGLALLRKRVR